jgi:lysophospholipase L1-like esterase
LVKRLGLQLSLALVVTIVTLEVCLQLAAWVAQIRSGQSGPADLANPQAINILCVGDSHTWGAGVEAHQNYPAQLETTLARRYPDRDVNAINLGLPGVNSSYVVARLEAQILRYRPDLVIVWVGTNNMWNTLEAVEADEEGARSLAARAHAALLRAKLYRLAIVLWHTRSSAFEPQPVLENDPQRAERHQEYLEWVAAGKQRSADAIEHSLRRDMRRMVDSARSLSTPILFVTYPQKRQKLPVSEVIEQVATELDAPVVVTARDRARALADGLIDLQLFVFSAGPHPSARMYSYVVESMLPHAIAAIERSRAGPK